MSQKRVKKAPEAPLANLEVSPGEGACASGSLGSFERLPHEELPQSPDASAGYPHSTARPGMVHFNSLEPYALSDDPPLPMADFGFCPSLLGDGTVDFQAAQLPIVGQTAIDPAPNPNYSWPTESSYNGLEPVQLTAMARGHIQVQALPESSSCYPGAMQESPYRQPSPGQAAYRSHACQWADCSKVFARRGDLKRHVCGIHIAERPFPCALNRCHRGGMNGFERMDKLIDHQRRVHGCVDPRLQQQKTEKFGDAQPLELGPCSMAVPCRVLVSPLL